MDSKTIERHHLAHLLLQRLPGAGAAARARLVEHFGSAEAVLQAPISQLTPWLNEEALDALKACHAHPDTHPLTRTLASDRDWLEAHPEVQLVAREDADYPPMLREIDRAPPLLYLRGNRSALSLPQLAVVGSRNPSPGGADNAHQFAAYLARQGFAITSGLALGVDGLAHAGALSVEGVTLAVMGTGIDRIYPARHRKLAQEILDKGGALISEFPLGSSPQAANFPQRNRIISGLSGGTLVVEAALKSGSLITARCALRQNREVFAIPGSIHNPLARGCHRLIREGATLVETAADIVQELTAYLGYQYDLLDKQCPDTDTGAPLKEEPGIEERRLLQAIGHDPRSLDSLVELTHQPVGELSALLIELELKGLVVETEAGYTQTSLSRKLSNRTGL